MPNYNKSVINIDRITDKSIHDSLKKVVSELGLSVAQFLLKPIFIGETQPTSFDAPAGEFTIMFERDSVVIEKFSLTTAQDLTITITRNVGEGTNWLPHDHIQLSAGQNCPMAKVSDLHWAVRKNFPTTDRLAVLAHLSNDQRRYIEQRESSLHRLENLQDDFLTNFSKFTLEQQSKHADFQTRLETDYAERQVLLEKQHQERLAGFEAKEAELKTIRAELDERENRQARRDIYKELKAKLDARNQTFELTAGTQGRRWIPFLFTLLMLATFAALFGVCFYKNVINPTDTINWVTVVSQIGSALAFVGVATFFIRWNNQWFQKHADEEFKLKRLDLDIDRANWLVELAMEWQNITKAEIPHELIDKLSRNLFVTDESKDFDVHPAETLLSSIFGKAGSINMEFPGRISMQRNEAKDAK